MHVLIIPSWYPETPESTDGIFFRQQAQALHRHGVRVGVTAPIFRSPRTHKHTILSTNYGIFEYEEDGVATLAYHSMYFFPRVPYLDRNRWIAAGKKLFRRYVAKYGRPDIIHAHSMNHAGVLAHQIHQETGIPYVLTEHSSTYARKLIADWQRPTMQQAAENCARRLAVSKSFCTLLQQEYLGLDWDYLPNILSPQFETPFQTAVEKSSNEFVFCSVGHLNRNKGFDILLPAFAQALKTHPDLRLRIGGGGALMHDLQQTVKKLGIDHAVTFYGALSYDQVLDMMRASDAFVLASRTETFGVVFIEALSQGLPVIATKCGGPESIVTNNNGFLVPTENIEALTSGLVKLYEQRHRYRPSELRQNCLNEYGETGITNRLINIYQEIIEPAGRTTENA